MLTSPSRSSPLTTQKNTSYPPSRAAPPPGAPRRRRTQQHQPGVTGGFGPARGQAARAAEVLRQRDSGAASRTGGGGLSPRPDRCRRKVCGSERRGSRPLESPFRPPPDRALAPSPRRLRARGAERARPYAPSRRARGPRSRRPPGSTCQRRGRLPWNGARGRLTLQGVLGAPGTSSSSRVGGRVRREPGGVG